MFSNVIEYLLLSASVRRKPGASRRQVHRTGTKVPRNPKKQKLTHHKIFFCNRRLTCAIVGQSAVFTKYNYPIYNRLVLFCYIQKLRLRWGFIWLNRASNLQIFESVLFSCQKHFWDWDLWEWSNYSFDNGVVLGNLK